MLRVVRTVALLVTLPLLSGCQSPTDPDATVDVVDLTAVPSPATAEPSSSVTYRVPRNNQPDEIREYDWKTSFTVTLRFTGDADGKIKFPVKISSLNLTVKQAAGGVVIVPSGGEVEHYTFTSQPSTNSVVLNGTATVQFDVWYDLPNLGREALITASFSFADNDSSPFGDSIEVRVAP